MYAAYITLLSPGGLSAAACARAHFRTRARRPPAARLTTDEFAGASVGPGALAIGRASGRRARGDGTPPSRAGGAGDEALARRIRPSSLKERESTG